VRVLVVGAGAIGCLLGGRLADAGHDVTLIGRSWLVDAVQAYGLDIAVESRDDQHAHVKEIKAAETIATAFELHSHYDVALLTTKAHDVAKPIADLAQATTDPPLVACFQNGVGTEELVADVIGPGYVIAGTISIPAAMMGPAVVETVQRGGIGLAPMTGQVAATPLVGVLREAGFVVETYSDYRTMKWSKLLLNIVGNATSAILGWPPERVYSHSGLFHLERSAFLEALHVMTALGLEPVSLPGYPLPAVLPFVEWLPSLVLRPLIRRAVRSGRGGKMPSMYVDLVAGRRQLEVDVLNGAVVRHGERLGLEVPVNQMLTDVLQKLASGETPREQYCDKPRALLDTF